VPATPPFRPLPEASVLPVAERLLRHEFDLLGSGPTHVGHPIDWSRDFKGNCRWPTRHASRVPLVLRAGCDIKLPWELGRCVHFGPLVHAYALTGEARWVTELVEQVDGLCREQPPGWGVQWRGPMDVAIRAVNWSLALAALEGNAPLSDDARARWLGALWRHGVFLRSQLSWNPHSPGNHYVSELVGLLHVGLVFGDTARGRSWARYAARALRRELRRQVTSDGVDWEASTGYHRLVAELFAQAAHVLRATSVALDLPPDPEFDARVNAMAAHVEGYSRPDGTAPLIGDADDGRLTAFGAPYELDPRRHLDALRAYWPDLSPSTRSTAWTDAGLFALRGAGALVLLRCGPVGLNGRGAHDHGDQLAVDVTLQNIPLFVDPGSFVYTRDPEARRAFRATAVHNTVCLDGADQVVFSEGTLFEVDVGAPAHATEWTIGAEETCFGGVHEGYHRLSPPVTHRRRVRLATDGRRLELLDRLDGVPGEHDVAITFQCAPGAWVSVEPNRAPAVQVVAAGRRFELTGVVAPGIDVSVEQGAVAPRYGVREGAPRIRFVGRVRVPTEARFDITTTD
jgi:hypothetical protein